MVNCPNVVRNPNIHRWLNIVDILHDAEDGTNGLAVVETGKLFYYNEGLMNCVTLEPNRNEDTQIWPQVYNKNTNSSHRPKRDRQSFMWSQICCNTNQQVLPPGKGKFCVEDPTNGLYKVWTNAAQPYKYLVPGGNEHPPLQLFSPFTFEKLTYVFVDAGINPVNNLSLKPNFYVCESAAQYTDPADRPYPDFYMDTDKTINYDLTEYGINCGLSYTYLSYCTINVPHNECPNSGLHTGNTMGDNNQKSVRITITPYQNGVCIPYGVDGAINRVGRWVGQCVKLTQRVGGQTITKLCMSADIANEIYPIFQGNATKNAFIKQY